MGCPPCRQPESANSAAWEEALHHLRLCHAHLRAVHEAPQLVAGHHGGGEALQHRRAARLWLEFWGRGMHPDAKLCRDRL